MKRLLFLIGFCLITYFSFAQVRDDAYGEGVYNIVEVMPRFLSDSCEQNLDSDFAKEACAKKAIIAYISDNLKVSEKVKQREISGLAVISFIVEKDSTVSNLRFIRSFDADVDSAIVRMFEEMPKWIPGRHLNKPERVSLKVPIRYTNVPQWLIDSFQYSIFTTVDDKPRFNTCDNEKDKSTECTDAAIKDFISQNIEYPEKLLKNKVGGRCVVKFVVEKDGTLSNFSIIQRTYIELNEEALRVVKQLPNFQPAIYRGVPVRNEMEVVIDFDGEEWKKIKKAQKKAKQ